MIKTRLLFILLFIFNGPLWSSEYESHRLENQTLTLTTSDGEVKVTALHEEAFEAWYKADTPQLPSFAKVDTLPLASTPLKLVDKGDFLLFSSKQMTVKVNKAPFKLSFFKGHDLLLEEEIGFFAHKSLQGFRFKLAAKERLLGGGARVLGMDRRGQRLPLYNRAHYGYTTHSEQMNFSIPAVMSDRKYSLLFDNSARGWLDLGKTDPDVLQFEAVGGRHAYIVMAGNSYPELIENYIRVTGPQPLPPRWAFGNHASRFGYRSQKQVLDTIAKYRKLRVPVDSIILDLYWFGPDVKGHMGNLDWDTKQFPQPVEMIEKLKQQDVNTVLITEPFILTGSKKWQEAVNNKALGTALDGESPRVFDFFFGNTGLVDVFSKEGRSWFGNIYKSLADQGVAGVWGDLGEPEVHPHDMLHKIGWQNGMLATGDEVHNAYGHEWARLVRDALQARSPKERPFMIMRAGFAGSQRYGMLPWTGDVGRTWGSLKAQVELSLQMGLLGLAYTHSDLGGFIETDHFDAELYVRWLQYGAFQPIYRPHAHDSVVPEPVFHGGEVAEKVKAALSWRYRLLPYNYSLAYENHSRGIPLMRPVFFAADKPTGDCLLDTKAYFWGANLLVMPVTAPGVSGLDYCLPEGNWFDYFSDTIYTGGDSRTIPVNEQQIPVLVKGGAIIPHAPDMQNTREYSGDELVIHYWFDADVSQSGFQLYQDDGLTLGYRQGDYRLLDFSACVGEDRVLFSVELSGGVPLIREKSLTLVIHNAGDIRRVCLGDKVLNSRYQPLSGQLLVDLVFDGSPLVLTLERQQ